MLKRVMDIIAAALGLSVLALPLLLTAAVIRLCSDSPVLFRQTRIGLGGAPFEMLKFRTMVVDAESTGRLSIGEDKRVTPIGRILRRYKLDEFPQLWNVLRGDMSLVGPRPEVPEYAFVYPEQERVWSVRPGITDPTALDLYNESELLGSAADPDAYYRHVLLPEKIKRYLEYVEGRTLWGDVRLIGQTLVRVFAERGRS